MRSVWQSIIDELETERRRLVDEIVHYPPPIPRCDVQFNTLLEERAGIAQELHRAEMLARETRPQEDEIKLLDDFILSSAYLSSETKHGIRSSLLFSQPVRRQDL